MTTRLYDNGQIKIVTLLALETHMIACGLECPCGCSDRTYELEEVNPATGERMGITYWCAVCNDFFSLDLTSKYLFDSDGVVYDDRLR